MRMIQICGRAGTDSLPPRPWSITPLSLALCWILFQKGCVLPPDTSPARPSSDMPAWSTVPAPALPVGGQFIEPQVPHAAPRFSDTDNPSLKQVSTLLRQAATMIDNNDRTALRLILQAVTILKQEAMKGSTQYEYDRVSTKRSSITAPLVEGGTDHLFRAGSVLETTTLRINTM